MPNLIKRAMRLIVQPEREWAAIALERAGALSVSARYFAPLALIGPLAYACNVLIGADAALPVLADPVAALRFALLTVIILVALMHALYLFYLGLHHVVRVRRSEAAECAGIVALASLVLSTAAGYAGGAVGLFPHIG